MSEPKLATCPNCGDGLLIPSESVEIGSFMGISDMTHVTCEERVLLVPGVDYKTE